MNFAGIFRIKFLIVTGKQMNDTAKHIILILIGFLFNFHIVAQDTLLLDLKTEYFKNSDTVGILEYQAKNIYYKANFSRELIQIAQDSAKLEYCFYYDKRRYSWENRTYYFSTRKDSLVTVTFNYYSETWKYEYLTDSLYKISRKINNLIETGFAKSLFPLKKINDFHVIDSRQDTLWTTKYSNFIFPELIINEIPIEDSVYIFCDSMPTYPGGLDKMRQDLLTKLRIDMPLIESAVLCTKIFVSFVIDKEGKMRNIRFVRSCGDGFVERAVLIALTELDEFTNGYMDNKPVNIRFTLPIHIDYQ